MAHGITTQLLLNPNQVWANALALHSPQPQLTPAEQQQQYQQWLMEAMQENFSAEELARLPASMRWMTPALPQGSSEPTLEASAELVEDSAPEEAGDCLTEPLDLPAEDTQPDAPVAETPESDEPIAEAAQEEESDESTTSS